jgi:hypothetical protein
MGADEYHRKAQHFLTLARQTTHPEDRAVMIVMAAVWMERAEVADQDKRMVLQEPEKQSEAERS